MRNLFLLVTLLAISMPSIGDEGMWTLDNFPKKTVKQKYGVNITDDWLETVKRSVARMDSGCIASFVSPNGLVLTNHHCSISCISQNSST